MNRAWMPQKCDAEDALPQIIGTFADWVKTLAEQANQVCDEADLQRLEERVRDEGQAILGRVFQTLAQGAVDAQQEAAHTRQTGWREVKGYRFEHADGCFGGASLESAEVFLPRLQRAADRVGQADAGTKVFCSDMATWITHGVAEHLPDWEMIADFYHTSEHLHDAGKRIYGEHHPRAATWGRYWSRRLKRNGAIYVAERLRDLTLFYQDTKQQSEVLALARFLDKHAPRMNYPNYQARGLPIGSGPMESFCKQLASRLKGPGMFWATANVTPMAHLVSRWSLEPERFLNPPNELPKLKLAARMPNPATNLRCTRRN